MQVNFFNRFFHAEQISIEKLFNVIALELKKKNVEVKIYTNPYKFNPLGVLKALFYFRKNQIKVNHITGDIHWVSMALNSKSTILTIHDIGGMFELKGIKKKIYFIFWIYLPIKKLKYVTVISKKTKEDIIKLIPWAANKIKVIYNCHTINNIYKGDKIFPLKPEILIVGTRSNKNIERIIEALEGISCNLNIVGSLSLSQKELLKKYRISYINYIQISDEELLELYKNAHIIPFISTFEGFGLPILEGQSQNCIIITSNIEPMVDIAGKGAIFVNPYDVASIRQGLNYVLSKPSIRSKLIEDGRENIKRFDAENIASQYADLYLKVLNRNI